MSDCTHGSARARRRAHALALLALAGCGDARPRVQAGPVPALEADLGRATIFRGDTSAHVATNSAPDPHPELDPERAAIDARQADIAQCYERAIAQTPTASGRVVLEVWFSAAGEVQRTHVASLDAVLEPARACLETALRGAAMESAAPASGVHARRTYTFLNPATTVTVSEPLAITPGEPPPREHPIESGATAGALREIEISAVVAARVAQLQSCYTAVLVHAPTAEGSATFRIDVAADGAVTAAAVDDAPAPLDGADDCLAGVLRTLRFRATGTASTVRYPASFARQFWTPP